MSTRWLISWYQWSFLTLFLLAELGTRPLINLPDTFYQQFWKRISPLEQIYRSFHADWRQTPSAVSHDLGLIAVKLQLTTDLIVTQSIDYWKAWASLLWAGSTLQRVPVVLLVLYLWCPKHFALQVTLISSVTWPPTPSWKYSSTVNDTSNEDTKKL